MIRSSDYHIIILIFWARPLRGQAIRLYLFPPLPLKLLIGGSCGKV